MRLSPAVCFVRVGLWAMLSAQKVFLAGGTSIPQSEKLQKLEGKLFEKRLHTNATTLRD